MWECFLFVKQFRVNFGVQSCARLSNMKEIRTEADDEWTGLDRAVARRAGLDVSLGCLYRGADFP